MFQTEKAMFERIAMGDVSYPLGVSVSTEARDLIASLLEKAPGALVDMLSS